MSITSNGARLWTTSSPRGPESVVLVLHGGTANSSMRVGPLSPAALRLVPVARSVARTVPKSAVYRLRFAIRGWNADGGAVLRDARWAVGEITRRHPGLPVVLLGHSLGGRVAVQTLRTTPSVVGAVGLAPWLVTDDAVDGLDGSPLYVVHGTRDRTIPEPSTRPWLARARREGARVESVLIERAGHPMLRYSRRWHRLAADGVLSVLATAEHPATPRPGMIPP